MYCNNNYWTRGSNSVRCPLYRYTEIKREIIGKKIGGLKSVKYTNPPLYQKVVIINNFCF